MVIYIIRHFEKDLKDMAHAGVDLAHPGMGGKHDLSKFGWQRAGQLADYFPLRFEKPDYIYTFKVKAEESNGRGVETCTPLANKHNIPLIANYPSDKVEAGFKEFHSILSQPDNDDKTFLICWEHKRIHDFVGLLLKDLADSLGIKKLPDVPQKWPDDNFDNVWRVTIGKKSLKLKIFEHGLAFPVTATPPAPVGAHTLFNTKAKESNELNNVGAEPKIIESPQLRARL